MIVFAVLGALVLYSLLVSCAAGETEGAARDFRRCLDCHAGIERLDSRHDFECGRCHLSPEVRGAKTLASHDAVVRNPSAPSLAALFCGDCHRSDIERLERSLHGTLAGIINQTRYLWGAQYRAAPPLYGLGGPLAPLPEVQDTRRLAEPADLVDDFLRRRCLRCHVHTEPPPGYALHRSTGCAACHVPYDAAGRYSGGDAAIDRRKTGYPATHTFERPMADERCLRCHRGNRVGADYHGLFELDVSQIYRPYALKAPLEVNRAEPGYHQLARDIHAQRGLLCVDCHGKEEVMGSGKVYGFQMESPGPRCEGCHGGWAQEAPSNSLEAVQKRGDEFVFSPKRGGSPRTLPLFRRITAAHGVDQHSRVRCSACHAQWSFQDYGLSVIRLDVLSGDEWYDLTAQGDPRIQEVLEGHLGAGAQRSFPSSRDFLNRTDRPGVWLSGWRFRRWEWLPLGVDHEGRISVMRPLYQYLVSYVAADGEVRLDSAVPERGDGSGKGWAFMPYVPHTIGPVGRSCDACHQERMSAGLGLAEDLSGDLALTVPSPPPVSRMRLLDENEQKALLEPTAAWGRLRLRSVMEE